MTNPRLGSQVRISLAVHSGGVWQTEPMMEGYRDGSFRTSSFGQICGSRESANLRGAVRGTEGYFYPCIEGKRMYPRIS